MSRQGSSIPENMSSQLCSFNEVMSRPKLSMSTLYFVKDADWIHNGDPTQRRISAESSMTGTEPTSKSNSCSSQTPPTEAAMIEADASLPKRRLSDSSSSLDQSEGVKRQRCSEDTGSACESSNRAHASMKATVSRSLQSPLTNEANSSAWKGIGMPSKNSLAGKLTVPPLDGKAPNVRPRLPLPLVPRTMLLRSTVGFIAGEAELFQRSKLPKENCTLSPLAPRLLSTDESPDREKVLLPPIGDRRQELNDQGDNSAFPRHSFAQPMVLQPMLPNFLESRRLRDAKSLDGKTITGVLVAGNRHLGPIMKPFDKPCYEVKAVE